MGEWARRQITVDFGFYLECGAELAVIWLRGSWSPSAAKCWGRDESSEARKEAAGSG